MRLGFVMLVLVGCLASAWGARAHTGDEFQQVTMQVTIDEQAVVLICRMSAEYASIDLFEGDSPIDLDRLEPADLAQLVQPMLAQRCPLSIDGVVVPPAVLRAEFQMPDSRLPPRSFPESQVMRRGEFVFAASYETKGAPRRVTVDWGIYANDFDEAGEPVYADEDIFNVVVTNAEGQETYSFVTPAEPGYTWHSKEASALPEELLAARPVQRQFITLPALSIGIWLVGGVTGLVLFRWKWRVARVVFVVAAFAGVMTLSLFQIEIETAPSYAELDDDEALAVFESLHRNIYRAFDYTDEGAVYDALAQSVDGPMLETIYNDVYQSLIMREENGAVSKVVRVEIEEAQVIDRFDTQAKTPTGEELGSLVVRAAWQVDGLVTHFGHTHERTNAFEAVYTLAPREQGWRIVEAQILQQRRIDQSSTPAEDTPGPS